MDRRLVVGWLQCATKCTLPNHTRLQNATSPASRGKIRPVPSPPTNDPTPRRQTAQARRDALLDVARALVRQGGPAAVTMGSVAGRAEVTRALVYKHFDNRDDVLAALYRREAAALDRQLRGQVIVAPDGFEPKLRAFVHAVLEAAATRSEFFTPLRAFGDDPAYRRQQRSWDRQTLRYFTGLAADEFALDPAMAKLAMSVLLSGIVSLLTQARADRTPGRQAFLEDVFVDMARASLTHLAGGTPPASIRPPASPPLGRQKPPAP
jgi:AcrR family transcriptional regulator